MGNSIFEDPDFFAQVVLGGAADSLDAEDPAVATRLVRLERQRLIRQAARINAVLRERSAESARRRHAVDCQSADLDQRERELRLWFEERSEQLLARETELQANESGLRTQAAGLASWEAQLHREQAALQAAREEHERRLQQSSAVAAGQLRAEANLAADLENRRAALEQRSAELESTEAQRATQWAEAFERLEATRMELDRQVSGLLSWEHELAQLFAFEVLSPEPDEQGSNEASETLAEFPLPTEVLDGETVANHAARTGELLDRIQEWLTGALEDRVVAQRVHRHVCRRCDPAEHAELESSVRERLHQSLANVVDLIQHQRHEAASWLAQSLAALQHERQSEQRRWEVRQRAWLDLKSRWRAIDPAHPKPSGPTFLRNNSKRQVRSDTV